MINESAGILFLYFEKERHSAIGHVVISLTETENSAGTNKGFVQSYCVSHVFADFSKYSKPDKVKIIILLLVFLRADGSRADP